MSTITTKDGTRIFYKDFRIPAPTSRPKLQGAQSAPLPAAKSASRSAAAGFIFGSVCRAATSAAATTHRTATLRHIFERPGTPSSHRARSAKRGPIATPTTSSFRFPNPTVRIRIFADAAPFLAESAPLVGSGRAARAWRTPARDGRLDRLTRRATRDHCGQL